MRKDLKTTYLGNYMKPTASEIISALEGRPRIDDWPDKW
jgi:hypothetical protein